MKDFNTFKAEILRRAKYAMVREDQYKRALESKTVEELIDVIKDNFFRFCVEKVIDNEIIDKYKSEFNSHDIYCNESRYSGYLLVTGHVNKIGGDCEACIIDNAVVNEVFGEALIDCISGSAVIKYLYGNAVIDFVFENAVIEKVFENAEIIYIYGNATIGNVSDKAKIINDCRN